MLGVGFGTEYFRNIFLLPNQSAVWSVVSEDTDVRLLIGTHNSVYDVAVKMGIPGLFGLFFWLIAISYPAVKYNNPGVGINSAVIIMLTLNNGLNMGVTSINFLLCTAMCSGWLISSSWRVQRLLGSSESESRSLLETKRVTYANRG